MGGFYRQERYSFETGGVLAPLSYKHNVKNPLESVIIVLTFFSSFEVGLSAHFNSVAIYRSDS